MMRRLAFLGVLVALALGAGSSVASVPAKPYPAYVDGQGTWVLLSNKHWHSGAGATRELRAQPVLLTSAGENQLPTASLQYFRYGENTLDVEVARNALPASLAACNTSARTLVGVAFGFRGYSAADLSVSLPRSAFSTP
jgi:hypothetical protein